MRRSLVLTLALALVIIAGVGQWRSVGDRQRVEASAGFVSPQVCPPATNSGAANVTTANVVSVAGDDATVKALTRKAETLLRSTKTMRSLRVRTPVTISGTEHSAVLSASRIPVWIAAQICQAPSIDSWFIGGSGAVDSQSRITMTNDGASDSTVEISAWTANGATTPQTMVVPSNSTTVVSLDRFALGSDGVAVRVRALSGRVAATLFDVRARGLSARGADFVPAGNAPASRQVIVGVKGGVPVARLRLLAPGNEDAVARVDLVAGEDRFTPRGLDQIDLTAGQVRDVDVPLRAVDGFGALIIESDAPVVAGLYQPAGQRLRDFAWLATSRPLSASALALPTQFPSTLLLFTPQRSTSVIVAGVQRRALPPIAVPESTIRASALRVPIWLEANDQVYGAIVARTNFGLSVSPVNPLARSRARIAPLPAISVIVPR